MKGFLVRFSLLAIFWIVLSGYFDFIHLFSGLLCCLLIAHVSKGLLDIPRPSVCIRMIPYIPWLCWQIILANLDVAYRVLHPRMPIDPNVVRFRADLHTDFGKVLLANSITLTPGTVTIDVEGDEFIVHSLTKKARDGLSDMQRKCEEVEGV
jgi:multicomponent Na+:H+ antiporter subunit E